VRRIRLWGLLLLAAPAAAFAAVPVPAAEPLHRFVRPAFEEVVVHWQIHSRVGEGSLRLYRGRDEASLRLIRSERVHSGVESFELRDWSGGTDEAFYELRYADPSGREESLGTILCLRASALRDFPLASAAATAGIAMDLADLSALLERPAPTGRVAEPRRAHPIDEPSPPPVPPPEA
jgi:hypothetical protein